MQRQFIVIAAILATGLLAGCRGEEQRSYVTDKGNYTGKSDNQLSAAQLSELNSRAALQGTANVTAGAARKPTEERPPPPATPALDQRLQQQSGTFGKN